MSSKGNYMYVSITIMLTLAILAVVLWFENVSKWIYLAPIIIIAGLIIGFLVYTFISRYYLWKDYCDQYNYGLFGWLDVEKYAAKSMDTFPNYDTFIGFDEGHDVFHLQYEWFKDLLRHHPTHISFVLGQVLFAFESEDQLKELYFRANIHHRRHTTKNGYPALIFIPYKRDWKRWYRLILSEEYHRNIEFTRTGPSQDNVRDMYVTILTTQLAKLEEK